MDADLHAAIQRAFNDLDAEYANGKGELTGYKYAKYKLHLRSILLKALNDEPYTTDELVTVGLLRMAQMKLSQAWGSTL